MFSTLLFTLATLSTPCANANNGDYTGNYQVQQCIRTCLIYNEKPGAELKACVARCQELAQPNK